MAHWSGHWGGASWSHPGGTKGNKNCWRQVYTHRFNLGDEAEYIYINDGTVIPILGSCRLSAVYSSFSFVSKLTIEAHYH